VIIDTSVKNRGGILANAGIYERLSARVILDEVRDVVNDTSNSDESTAILGFSLILIPVDDWKLLKWNTPVESCSLLVKFLLELLDATFFDLISPELF